MKQCVMPYAHADIYLFLNYMKSNENELKFSFLDKQMENESLHRRENFKLRCEPSGHLQPPRPMQLIKLKG